MMLNKHTRRRFIWWFDSFRAKNDPFTSIIRASLIVHSLQRRETKQNVSKYMPDWVGKESHIISPFIIGELEEVK
jgi:hypothetical protein